MKKTILFCGALLMGSLAFGQKTDNTPVLGGDKDAHGCKASAGYTFSYIKNDCVRTFEQKVQLKEQNPKGSYTTNAAVIFSKDMKKAEIFVPESASGVILNKVGKKAVWKRGDYELTQNQKVYSLKKGNVVAYKQ
ncbi:hypothetical protein BAZ12_12205 [Elizabethkingia miricola]|uniref:C-type lysozyme inhibitor domain-containing protein n=1 Tax=Elizabethkingia miricola TaxID=172045 RepID=A0ABD4DPL0_ELIMR|nr:MULTISPECIES: hypothetical protein [Elizabethkingia]KUY20709.1 hypothetical protein ATB95_07345 [Elizabethkingia miricola]MCL1653095.1 hypothetical protein [Elizabethkingia miricola]MCL1677880.1 hypothetical protein [Elizabethkingia miricola]OPC16604.1 hypothetical protein BAY01_02585 [Elizabethkingia miricola]OPC70530.1 hypothetical protein BAZ12_12205 [Elizabethkingia miricola]